MMTIYVNKRKHTFKKVFTDDGAQHKMLEGLYNEGWLYFEKNKGFQNGKKGDAHEQFIEFLTSLPRNIQNELRMNLLALRGQLDFGFPTNEDLYQKINDIKSLRFALCWLAARGANLYMVQVDENVEFMNLRQDVLMSNTKETESLIPKDIRTKFDPIKYISNEDIIRGIWNNELLTIVNCDEFGFCSAQDWNNHDVATGIRSLGNRQDMTQPEIDNYMQTHYDMKPAMIKYY